MPGEILTFHYLVEGRVQGVCFRYYTRQLAVDLGIRGWIRNAPEGNVEAVAQGPAEQLEAFERFLHQGPERARVMRVQREPVESGPDYPGFSIVF